jgi:hypothetical protein
MWTGTSLANTAAPEVPPMMPCRLFAVCVMLLVLGAPLGAAAGPGDPRLIHGLLEWPAVMTNEPFVIVRGEDGVLYYVTVAATRRAGAVTAGARVSVLGIEGRGAHEITAVGFGSGPSAEAALADLQSTPAKVAPAPSVPVAPAASAPPAPAHAPSAPTTVSPVAPATPTPQPAPATETAAAPKSPAAKPGAGEPTMVPASTPTPAKTATPPAKTTTPPAHAPTVPLVVPRDDQRWVEISGEVERLVGRTLVLKVDGGRVSVDVSGLNANLERAMAPGTMVKVYGVPVELKFKAMGIMQ